MIRAFKNTQLIRTIIFVLISAILFTSTLVAPISVLSSEVVPSPYIVLDGKAISELNIQDDEKVMISAEHGFVGKTSTVWQIMDKDEEGRWLDISEVYSKELPVTYSLIGSMLKPDGTALLRCKLENGGKEYYTAPVTVTVSFTVVDSFPVIYTAETEAPTKQAPRAEEEKTTHSIVINYLFDNNAIAFEPYGASIGKGSDFKTTVKSPPVVGYAPFRRDGDNYIDASVVEIDIKNIQSDVTINVIYEPALVNFSIHHHLQNLLDDDYSVHYDLITTSKALTGSTVGDGLALTEEQLPGFKALEYEHLTVAADGSTVIEIRYDRNYYLVDFDMNGGFGTEPVYTRYGATVGANNPIRHGYVFGGWELVSYGDSEPTAEQKSKYEISSEKTIIVPDANLRFRAIWITQNTTYTMVFWQENADDDGYSYWGYLDGLSAMSGSYVDGRDLVAQADNIEDEAYFTFNPQKTDKHVLVEGDGSTVVNVYYTRNRYAITFKAPGLCQIPEGHVHGDDCYKDICDLGHTHDESCIPTLTCTTPEHLAHTESCIICGMVEHTHGSAGCNCQIPEHTHAVSCWGTDVGNEISPSNAPKNPKQGQIYSYRQIISRIYCVYLFGKWYRYTGGGVSSGDILDPECGYSTEHTHGSDCPCDIKEHRHSSSCYKDVIHSHSEKCYSYSCGQIDHVHTSDCLLLVCGIPENHSHGSACTKSSSTNTVKIVYAKYQQSLETLWPVTDDNGVTYDSGERWKPSSSSYYSEVLVYIAKMPPDDFTLTLDKASHTPYTMNYYLQVLPGEPYTVSYDGKHYLLDNTIKASYSYVTKAEDFFDIAGFKQYKSNPSFSGNQINISGNNRVVNFYYDRIVDHYLEFNNNGIVLDNNKVYGIMYGAPISQYNFTPDYPSNLEPGAYTFGGWYISPGCFDGTEVNWDSIRMPEGDLMLYAKWKPITHTVKIFKDAELTEQIGDTQIVDHKAFATAPKESVTNGNYVFQGWFYMDVVGGVRTEKAFVFTGIPVVKDMNIYAKWSSHVSVDYKINYVLHSTKEPVADPTVGSAIAGHNKTFDAKAGDQLYPQFSTGYYPLVNSHTITMSVDGTLEFTFEYVYVEKMPYRVEYVNKATGEKLCDDKVVSDNSLSVVTETFVRFDGMMPDAYQKRLVLSASGTPDSDGVYENNVITFYYSSDSQHAYYRVVHYIANIHGGTYREYRSEEFVGNIGSNYTIDAISLTGFRFAPESTMVNQKPNPVSGTSVTVELKGEGLLVELYYDRETYGYTVKYVDSATRREIISAKQASGVFGEQVLEYAYDLTAKGYTLVSENLKILTVSANPELNTLEFLYSESLATIKYEIVGPKGCGTLSQSSENLTAFSGTAIGSTPIPAKGFIFMGWFTDNSCKLPVSESLVDSSGKLSPVKAANEIWTDRTYYAKFAALEADIKISVTSATVSDDQNFIFKVSGKAGTETEKINLFVTINGNGASTIVDLPLGEYTITELSGWSWRYYPDSVVKNITLEYSDTPLEVPFNHTRTNGKWLDGNSHADNIF